jgi:Carboxypeptidase regulatory-like domain
MSSFPRLVPTGQRLVPTVILLSLVLAATSSGAQTFGGGISGRVTDESGGVLPGVSVTATHVATGVSRTTETSTTGQFSFPDLPLGAYRVEATLQGFQPQRATVEVVVSRISPVELKLGLSTVSETVQVSAAALTLDTVSTALSNVISPKQVQDLPLNGRNFTRLLQLTPGAAGSAINGNRTRGNNYQIDGADNNDAFQNVAAVNQGGVSGIAGTLLPIDAIDQFSVQAGGGAEQGRNSGSTVNLVIKSGTNELHGSTYYFNRHEALAAQSPIAAPDAPKRQIRNNQGGFSLGGPIVKNKAFFFSTFESQRLTAGNTTATTTPSDAWVANATQLLNQFSVPVNPVSVNLLALWPQASRTGVPATANNYISTDPNDYTSHNGIIKVDQQFNADHRISVRYFGGGGPQTAQTNSPFGSYYQHVPSLMHNISIIPTWVISPHLLNQLVIGYNYFKQTFNSADLSFNPADAGLNTGVADDPDLAGPPNVTLSGFASVGGTQPLGRVDDTWHVTESLSYAKGAHQLKLGGELRTAKLFVFYDSNKRGNFTFDGTVGPWSSLPAAQVSPALKALADYMAGYVATGSIVRGNTHHHYVQNSWDLYAQDAWTITPQLTINFGLRYTNPGVLHASDGPLTTFIRERGMVSTEQLYPNDANNFSPRAGFAYTPRAGGSTVVRGSYGMFFDMLAVNFFTANTGFANGGALGVGNNPGGSTPVYSITQNRFTLVNNQPVFGSEPRPPYGAFAASQDLQLPYVHSFNINVQQQLNRSMIAQIGYVGTRGRHLALMRDINAPPPNAAGLIQANRPFAAQYPELAAINELVTIGRSSYNSLQLSLIQNSWHGLSGRANYTFGHAMDNGSEARNTLPMDSTNIDLDWGNATFDVRHVFTSGLNYDIPAFSQSRLGEGWQVNAILHFQSGSPFNVTTGTDRSGTGARADRPNVAGDPFEGVVQPTSGQFQAYFNPAAFALQPAGTYGSLARNAYYGPGFKTVDLSVFKTTKIDGRVSLQARLEIFNVFNWTNWANPGSTLSSSTTLGLLTNTREGNNAPGIGSGEPRNIQLALKLIF